MKNAQAYLSHAQVTQKKTFVNTAPSFALKVEKMS